MSHRKIYFLNFHLIEINFLPFNMITDRMLKKTRESDMDKIGKSSTKHECLKNPLFDVARIFIGIGLSRDICEPLDKLPKTPSEISNSPTSPATIRNVQNQVQPSPPSSPNLSALLPHVSSDSFVIPAK